MDIKIKRNSDEAKIPTQGSDEAAGWDLYADLTKRFPTNGTSEENSAKGLYHYPDAQTIGLVIMPHCTMMVSTGVSMAIPDGYWGGIYARSGLATKQGLRPANCVGVIDSDYRGDIIVALHNDTDEPKTIFHHDRIGQFILHKVYPINWIEVNEDLNFTNRGEDGFGKSGR